MQLQQFLDKIQLFYLIIIYRHRLIPFAKPIFLQRSLYSFLNAPSNRCVYKAKQKENVHTHSVSSVSRQNLSFHKYVHRRIH